MFCRDRQESFIVGIIGFIIFVFFLVKISLSFFIRILKQFFSILTPCSEMVFIESHQIPVCSMDEFIFCLYPAIVVGAKKVLKRTENDDGTFLVRCCKSLIDIYPVTVCILVGYELPSFEIHMTHQVLRPG